VKLDGQPAFEIYYKEKLIGRKPSVKRTLSPGTHTFWPGEHSFDLAADGSLKTSDPELLIDGNTVKLKCYPVTLAAYQVNSPESTMNVDLRLIGVGNLSIGVETPAPAPAAAPDGKEPPKAPPVFEDLVPFYRSFKPLVIWLPATGKGAPWKSAIPPRP